MLSFYLAKDSVEYFYLPSAARPNMKYMLLKFHK